MGAEQGQIIDEAIIAPIGVLHPTHPESTIPQTAIRKDDGAMIVPVFPSYLEQFSPEALAEAENITVTEELLSGRDRVGGVSIDPSGALDKDDAFDIEEGVIHVHIADPTSLIGPDSVLDMVAKMKYFTRYYGIAGNDPMFPRIVSEWKLSLHEGTLRPVFTTSIPIDEKMRIGPVVRKRAALLNRRALSYSEADRIIFDDNDPEAEMLRSGYRISQFLAKGRGTSYDMVAMTEVSEEGEEKPINWGEAYRSMTLVRELMIMNNRLAAQQAIDQGVPILFRVHDRLGERAYYSPYYTGHVGLGFGSDNPYTHFTSPLRRLADFVTHAQLAAAIEGGSLPYTLEELTYIADEINRASDQERMTQGKALFLKELANSQARHALQAGDLKGLDEIPPRRVIKVATQEGLVDAMSPWLMMKLANGDGISGKHITSLLFSVGQDEATLRLIGEVLEGHPILSREALEVFCEEKGIPPPRLRSVQSQTGVGKNQAIASLGLGDREISSDPVTIVSKRDARASATVDLIRKLRQDPDFQGLLE